MVDVAQSVRVTDCGSEGRGFESHLPPKHLKRKDVETSTSFFCFGADVAQTCLQTHLPQNNIVDSSTFALSVCWRPRGERSGTMNCDAVHQSHLPKSCALSNSSPRGERLGWAKRSGSQSHTIPTKKRGFNLAFSIVPPLCSSHRRYRFRVVSRTLHGAQIRSRRVPA